MSSGSGASRGSARVTGWRYSSTGSAGPCTRPVPDRDPPTRCMETLPREPRGLEPGEAAEPAAMMWSTAPARICGIPLIAALGDRADRPRVFVLVHNLDRPARPRGREDHAVRGRAAALAVPCRCQYDFLEKTLGVPRSKLHLLLEHVNNRFFSPGPPSPDKTRPLIVGVGLERRDYRTLAQAVSGLDVDIRISGFSYHAAAMTRPGPDAGQHVVPVLLLARPGAALSRCRRRGRAGLSQPVRGRRDDPPGRDGVPASRRGDPLAGPLRLPGAG